MRIQAEMKKTREKQQALNERFADVRAAEAQRLRELQEEVRRVREEQQANEGLAEGRASEVRAEAEAEAEGKTRRTLGMTHSRSKRKRP